LDADFELAVVGGDTKLAEVHHARWVGDRVGMNLCLCRG
jgi:hypothetical protein